MRRNTRTRPGTAPTYPRKGEYLVAALTVSGSPDPCVLPLKSVVRVIDPSADSVTNRFLP